MEVKVKQGKTYEVDPTMERSRQCPECKQWFEPPSLSRKFCNQKCKDAFHNRTKREKAKELQIQLEQKIETEKVELLQKEASKEDERQEALETNIEILNNLQILDGEERIVLISPLLHEGFKFSACTLRTELPGALGNFISYYGSYMMALTKSNQVLIKKLEE